ncbi:hypothetical protein [Dongia rigui]|uniref:Uncharacterized protein n=1 Tax=Dongia rigui TaxID=940149 RepID=A0ABU5DV78_9PROT|nr:hypothetical protein [Dongia rigui]MDY0871229.1 hypothetical protein [Dongia rigui]
MLSMFSKRAEPEKPNDRSRIEVSLGRPDAAGNVTPLKVPQAGFAEVRPPRAAQPQGLAQGRAKIFENVPSVGQYLYHLNSDIRAFTRAETAHAVSSCTPIEVQRVARLLAKLKGRYLAQIVDLASGKRGPIGELDVVDIRRAREMAEEVELGLAALRQAIENGDLALDGVKAE